MRRLLFIAFAITCNAFILSAATYYGSCGDKLAWSLNSEDSTLTITGQGIMTNWEYTNSVPWYQHRSLIATVILPNAVTTIGNRAFQHCVSLRNINLPNKIISIGDYAFSSCSSLQAITIPSSVTSIGTSTFANCIALNTINISNGVASIGQSAFYNCQSLSSIYIPKSITSIGSSAFSICSSMTNINVEASNPSYNSIDGVLFDKTITTLIQYPIGKNESTYLIPSSVTTIGNFAFEGCSFIDSINIPNNIVSICRMAFHACDSLNVVNIGSGVTTIEEGAFFECYSLTAINVNRDNSKYSSKEGVLYDKTGTALVLYPIKNTMTSYTIADSVTLICQWAFHKCIYLSALTCEAEIPPRVLDGAFYIVDKSIPLYVPANSIDAYKSAAGWNEFFNIQQIISTNNYVTNNSAVTNEKFIRNGQLLILRDGKTYTVQGQEVR